MTTIKKCAWCGKEFSPTHNNRIYHLGQCEEDARLERQKRKRAPIARFLPTMMKNHEQIETIFNQGMFEVTAAVLEAFEIDISLCQHVKAPDIHAGKLMLDFGNFYLITEPDFLTFKIYKHEQATATVTTA